MKSILYVTAGLSKTMRYDVLPDDTVANPVKFLDAGIDGIKVDRKGNVYSTVRGSEIWITSPEGKHLGTLKCRRSRPSQGRASSPRILLLATPTARRCTLRRARIYFEFD